MRGPASAQRSSRTTDLRRAVTGRRHDRRQRKVGWTPWHGSEGTGSSSPSSARPRSRRSTSTCRSSRWTRRIRRRSSPRDVIVAIKSAAVGWVDLLMTSGQYQHMPKPPYTPRARVRGRRRVERRRRCASVRRRRRACSSIRFLAGPALARRLPGATAASRRTPSRRPRPCCRIPGTLSFDQACNLLGNYETAYHCLVTRGRLAAGETVLIHGASGATGLAAVHVAKLLGATVIATGRSAAKLAIVAAAGRRSRRSTVRELRASSATR